MSDINRYTKKPITIEAIQWSGSNLEECIEFLGASYGGYRAERKLNGKFEINIITLEGQHIASKGDYLIRGIKGEHYPCKPDIFEKTYEPENSNNAISQAKIDAVRLLDAAACPCCDKSGAYYDNCGEVQQCQWCYEVEQLKEQG